MPLHSYSVRSHFALIVHCTPSCRLCALALSVLSHCALIVHSAPSPPVDSVPLHSLYSQLCTLYTHSALSTLHSRTLCALDPLLLSLYSRLCIIVVCTLTLHSHTLCTLDSAFSWSALCLCTLTLCSHRTLLSLLSSLCPRTLGTLDSALSHSTDTLCTHNLCTLDFGSCSKLVELACLCCRCFY